MWHKLVSLLLTGPTCHSGCLRSSHPNIVQTFTYAVIPIKQTLKVCYGWFHCGAFARGLDSHITQRALCITMLPACHPVEWSTTPTCFIIRMHHHTHAVTSSNCA